MIGSVFSIPLLLDSLIPQYNETEEVMRPMLESISTQQGVDLKNDIEVIIANDGSDVKLPLEFLGSFSYPIQYIQCEHSGLPGTRGHLFDAATADYVMFCDAGRYVHEQPGSVHHPRLCEKGL